MKSLQFDFSGASLNFLIDEKDWCQVELVNEKSTIQLGADSWQILSSRLKEALTNLSNSNDPEWMLSLSEKHCRLFRQSIDGKNSFFWIDAEGNEIWRSKPEDPVDEESLSAFAN